MAFEGVSRQLCLNKGIPVNKINEGFCFEWARQVTQLCPAAQIFYIRRLVPHAFIYFAGRWYDAQMPKGTCQWQELPTLKSCTPILQKRDLKQWHPGDCFWQ